MTIDTHFTQVSLLLNCNGTNGSTTFTDVSWTTKTPSSVNGNAKISTAQNMFGGASGLFDGTGDWVEYASHTDFDFGSSDFTLEFWIRPANVSTNQIYLSHALATIAGNNDIAFAVSLSTLGKMSVAAYVGGVLYQVADTNSLATNSWYHIAVCRSSGTMYLYRDGVSVGSPIAVAGVLNTPASRVLRVGKYSNTGGAEYYANGYIDDLRITKGYARYPSGTTFTPQSDEMTAPPAATGVANLTLPLLTTQAYGSYSGTVILPAISAVGYGGINAAIALPMVTFAGYAGATSNISLPAITASGYFGGGMSHVFGAVSVYAAGHDSSGENSLTCTLPTLSVMAYGGANFSGSLGVVSATGTGTGTALGSANLKLPAITVSATGLGGGVGSANIILGDDLLGSYRMVGYGGALCSVSIGGITVAATGTSGVVGNAAVVLPMLELAATGTLRTVGNAAIILPAIRSVTTGKALLTLPSLTLVAIGTATVTATYEAYAVNLKHTSDKAPDEVTRYTNFPFTHIVRYQNSYFGANENGLFLLEGTTDYAATPTAIPWAFKTATTDFGYPEFKTIESAYIGGRLGASETLTLYAGEGKQTQAYSYTTPRGELAQNYRQKFGKGIKNHRYYALGSNGSGELVVDTIDFNVAKLSRRI